MSESTYEISPPLEFSAHNKPQSEMVAIEVMPGRFVHLLIKRLAYRAEDTCPYTVQLTGMKLKIHMPPAHGGTIEP